MLCYFVHSFVRSTSCMLLIRVVAFMDSPLASREAIRTLLAQNFVCVNAKPSTRNVTYFPRTRLRPYRFSNLRSENDTILSSLITFCHPQHPLRLFQYTIPFKFQLDSAPLFRTYLHMSAHSALDHPSPLIIGLHCDFRKPSRQNIHSYPQCIISGAVRQIG